MADRWANLRARAPVTVVFVVAGLSAGTWAARIPAIKAGLNLSPGVLGLCLLGPAVGSVLTMPLAGAIMATVPPRRVVQCALLLLAGMLPLTTVASSPWQLFAVLAGWGAGLGVVDVGMNIEASAVQDRLERRTMSGFHAAYSVGGLAGAGLGGIAAAIGVSPRADFIIVGVVVLVAGGVSAQFFSAARQVPPEAGAGQPRASRWPLWSLALVCLAVMAFASFLAEGVVADWSAVYLHSSLGAPVGLAAAGYTVFSCTMVGGRLAGDRLADLLGPARLVRLSAGLAAAGFGVALLIGQVWSGLVGFALLGVGLSVVVPMVFSAAAKTGRPGPNLALVTTSGYVGMLVGPALVGGLAQATSLHAALGIDVILCALCAALAGFVRPRQAPGEEVRESAKSPVLRRVGRRAGSGARYIAR
jgi:MFS family permease